jgi:hypothetical protein
MVMTDKDEVASSNLARPTAFFRNSFAKVTKAITSMGFDLLTPNDFPT